MLTLPPRPAVATKNIFCFIAKSFNSLRISKYLWLIVIYFPQIIFNGILSDGEKLLEYIKMSFFTRKHKKNQCPPVEPFSAQSGL
jgi:hypothetical protein